jgi:serine/threonine protein kinase
MIACLDDATVQNLVEGSLASEARASARAHITQCTSCRQLVASMMRTVEPALAATASLAGALIGRRFLLEDMAGRGGMGTVWRARDRETGSIVAVKLMRGGDHADRFIREAQVLATLHHPHIVRYIDHGLTGEGDPYLAMEWLEGIDLAQRLGGAPMPIADAIRVASLAAEALVVAHARGVIHRDIKPSNLFLPRGNIEDLKVLDFGIARIALASQAMTRTGAALGTPGYMAPEQARGERDLDARADLFALGCVLFEAVSGRAPFAGAHLMAVLAKVLFEDAPRLRELRPTRQTISISLSRAC